MKKLFLLVILCCSFLFAQGWNNEVTTTMNEPYFYTMDMFTNSNGHHILIFRHQGNTIVYYKLNSQGEVQGNPITITDEGFFPAITGSNEVIYALYFIEGTITGKYSTDKGSSWSDIPYDLSIGSNPCSNIDAVTDSYGSVHLVYATKDSDPHYKTYYYKLNQDFEWVDGQDVTNHQSAPYGGWPSIALSSGRIHVSFIDQEWFNSRGNVFTRDKTEGQWQTPQAVVSGNNVADDAKLIASGDYLYMIHDQWNSSTSKLDLKYKYRSLNSNNWSGGDIHNGGSAGNETFSVCKTHDGKLQLVYDFIVSGESPNEAIYHRSYDGHNWSDTFTLDDSWFGGQNGLTSVSNDFFVLWRPGEDAYLHYRQYDTIPLAPQNLAVQIHSEGGATYPKLTWSFNNEPDVFIKTSAYQVWRRHSISGGSWSNWSIIGYRDGDENQYIDYTISGLYAEANTAEYKLRVSDYTNHLSDYSSSVSVNFSEFNKISSGYVLNEYGLEQNYPNPFNPTTTISYSIKSSGLVTLKVYDIMGTEVASLVNENKEAGNYTVTFNASELPSGIYFYTVTSGNFKDTKKLILLK